MIQLRKIDSGNIGKVTKLSINDSQKKFVTTNSESIFEAYVAITSGHVVQTFAICDDETPVGFVMFSYGSIGDQDEPKIADRNYAIWSFMIDKHCQGRGYGKAALNVALDYLRTMPCGQARHCWLSYEPENLVAKALYALVGFKENGEMCGEETVAVIKL